MPLYEYRCPVCDRTVEVLQRMEDPAPECRRHLALQLMEKLPTAGSFRLKGTGWFNPMGT